MLLEEAYAEQNTDSCIGILETAARDYHKARDTAAFMKQATIDQLHLLKAQMALEKALKRPGGFVNMPLGETIFTVIMAGDMRRADQLRKDFKVPDKRWWWIKVRREGGCVHVFFIIGVEDIEGHVLLRPPPS